jgi:hypothetical protein
VTRLLFAAAGALLVFYLAVYVAYAANLMQFPFDYDQGEGFELNDVMLLSQGELPYQDMDTYPFYGSIYPPVYHLLAVPFAWIFGPSYWYGRAISFVATLITALAIGYAVYRGTRRPVISGLAGLAFLASNIVYHVGPLFRQHMTMVMFETLAVIAIGHAMTSTTHQRRWLAIGAGLLLLAAYTKPLALFTAGGALLYVVINSPKRGLAWTAVFGAIGAALFAALTVLTGGNWWTLIVTANVKDYYPSQASDLLGIWFRLHGFLIVPAILYALYELYLSRLSVYTLWFAVAAIGNAFAAGTWGAGDSYYATSIAALCVLSGIGLGRLLNGDLPVTSQGRISSEPPRRAGRILTAATPVLVSLLYLGYGVSVMHIPTTTAPFDVIADLFNIEPNAPHGFYDSAGRRAGSVYTGIGHFTTEQDRDAGEVLAALVELHGQGAPVLSEEAGFVLYSNREVVGNPVVLKILSEVDAYDSLELITMIVEQRFSMVILRAQFYPADVLEAIGQYYRLAGTVNMNNFQYEIRLPMPGRGSATP